MLRKRNPIRIRRNKETLEKQKDVRKLIDTALGKHPADLVVKDGLLMDVYTGRMVPHRSVAMVDEWISYVGPDADHAIGENTRVIEAKGRVLCPGLIDAHTHLVNYWNMADFLTHAMPCGVTTFFTEMENQAFLLGVKGVELFLEQMEDCPAKFYTLIPPMISLSPSAKPFQITGDQISKSTPRPPCGGSRGVFLAGRHFDPGMIASWTSCSAPWPPENRWKGTAPGPLTGNLPPTRPPGREAATRPSPRKM